MVNSNNIKGASAAVYIPGQGLWNGVSGISSVGVPITPEMHFGIGSSAKLFIATVLAKLQEQGFLSLDDHLFQWLSSYPYIDSTATIRQLLSHESGFFCYILDNPSMTTDSIWADTTRFWTPDEILATIGPPHFTPGYGYYYSNTNYLLAGMIIEAATGKTWLQNLHDIIFDPLDMDSTFVGAFETPNGPVAHEWVNDSVEIVNSPMTSMFSLSGATGAIMSTVFEMIQWYRALFNGTIISGSSMNEILDIDPSSLYGLGICSGIVSENINDPDYFHSGLVLGYRSLMYYNIKTHTVLCFMANSEPADFSLVYNPLLDVLNNEYPKQQNDAGIVAIISPWQNSCSANVTPIVTLTNFGSDSLTTVNINYNIDAGLPLVFNWSGVLSTGKSVDVTLPAINATNGSHTFISYTSSPNGGIEGYTFNDTSRSQFIVNLSGGLFPPFSESFEGAVFPPTGWVKNSNAFFHWGQTSLASFNSNYSAVKCNYLDYNDGSFYDLDMPLIDISNTSNPTLFFDYAYTHYPGYYDTLHILISTDCGLSWQTLFYKGGDTLMTAPTTTDVFYPDANQWSHETIPLDSYTGDVLIRFRVIAGYGNNLYLDNVIIDQTIGISHVASNESGVSVYPNPATNMVNIEGLPPDSEFQIANVTGKILLTGKTEKAKNSINISHLPKGVYFLMTQKGAKKILKF